MLEQSSFEQCKATALKEGLITQAQIAEFKDDKEPLLKCLLSQSGITALRNHWITPREALNFPDAQALGALLSDIGLQALRESLITSYQARSLAGPPIFALNYLLSEQGLIALRNGWITTEQVISFKFKKPYVLRLLLSDGFPLLQKGLIRAEDIAKFPDNKEESEKRFLALCQPYGETALRRGWITPQQAAEEFKNAQLLRVFLERAPKALEAGLITLEKAVQFHDAEVLKVLLSETGFNALQEGLITPEEAFHFQNAFEAHDLLGRQNLIKRRQEKIRTIVTDASNKVFADSERENLIAAYSSKFEIFYNLIITESEVPDFKHNELKYTQLTKISTAVFKMTTTIFDEKSTPKQKQDAINEVYQLITPSSPLKTTLKIAALALITAAAAVGGFFAGTFLGFMYGGVAGAAIAGTVAAAVATKLLFFIPSKFEKCGKELIKAATTVAKPPLNF